AAQRQQALREEGGERLLHATQLEHVGDVAAALDREHEVVWRLVMPAAETVWMLQRIEAAVEFDGGEAARGMFQLAPLRQPGRIEGAAPARIAPAGNPDPCTSLCHQPRSRRLSLRSSASWLVPCPPGDQPPARPPPTRPG